MLASLTVQNFAIISNINIEFDKGLTILTGETGAGKSSSVSHGNAVSSYHTEGRQTNGI